MPDMYSTFQLNKQDQADHTRQAAIDKPLRKIPKKREFVVSVGAGLPAMVSPWCDWETAPSASRASPLPQNPGVSVERPLGLECQQTITLGVLP